MQAVQATWPGPHTWVFPASSKAPAWIIGSLVTWIPIAPRITNHPIARQLCLEFGGPIVSTSANPSGEPPAKATIQIVPSIFGVIDFILEAKVGKLGKPTNIKDALTNKIVPG